MTEEHRIPGPLENAGLGFTFTESWYKKDLLSALHANVIGSLVALLPFYFSDGRERVPVIDVYDQTFTGLESLEGLKVFLQRCSS